MRILCDHPEAAAPFLPVGAGWQPFRAGGMPEDMQNAWRLCAGDRVAFGVETGDERLGCLIIIDRAERSQFGLVTHALQSGTPLPDPLACLALEGRNFQGQRGRSWVALRGNLHLTTYHPLAIPAGPVLPALTALPAVAAAESIEAVAQGRIAPGIKWVNDILVAERKVAGVLTATQVQGADVQHVVFGIGINVARTPQLEPAAYLTPPRCLAESVPRAAELLPGLLFELLRQLGEGVRDIKSGRAEKWIAAYRRRSVVLGRDAVIWPEEKEPSPDVQPLAEGRVVDLLPDLSLKLEGAPAPVRNGRLVLKPGPLRAR